MSMLHIASDTSKSHIKGLDDKCIQPNCAEVRATKILKVDLDTPFEISEESKTMRVVNEVPLDDEGFWNLNEGVYEVVYGLDEINIAEGEAGWFIGRSTYGRNGITLESSLFDSGFSSNFVAGRLIVRGNGGCRIKHNTRIGQFILVQSETLKLYDGSWGNNSDGTVKEHEKRYID
jgi:deoxycytidine triphosphate deaminase